MSEPTEYDLLAIASYDPASKPPLGPNPYAQRRTRILQDHVILRFPDLPKTSAGGISLEAKQFYERTTRDATVVAVGPGTWVRRRNQETRKVRYVFQPTELRPGDRVLVDAMHTQTGLLSEWDGERGDFRRVRESDVAAVLDGVEVEVS
jgi:co-chaperonin GroES (HSP10)